jgi:hypothetical protein
MRELVETTADDRPPAIASPAAVGRPRSAVISGYIDMPPFPPGITRSDAQREEATTGRFESAVMWGLGRYAHVERLLPWAVRRRQSHIVYGFAGR